MLSRGIDVHKAQLQIAIHGGKKWRSATTPTALRLLAQRLQACAPDVVVLDPSGGDERPVLEALWAANVPVALAPPKQVRTLIRGLGIRAKSDPLDAKMLAIFGMITTPRLVTAPSPEQHQVQALVRYRRTVIQDRVRLANQREQAMGELVRDRMDTRIAALQAEEAALDTLITEAATAVPDWARRRQILLSVPGVGVATMSLLLAELPELGTAASKQLASLVGVAPSTQHSGAGAETAHIEGGRRHLRQALWMPTMSAMRSNPAIKALATRLADNGKPHKVIVIACMRKLLHILNAMVANDTEWDRKVVVTT